MARVLSVNVGPSAKAEWAELGVSSMDKRPADEPVRVTTLGITSDTQTHVRHHGGVDQAVYAFAREDLDLWSERLGVELRNGQFAENLTTEGIDVNEAEIGERWRIGSVLLEVCHVRTPCNDFKSWMGFSGYDNSRWVKKFTAECRPGPYLRVIEEGVLKAGDAIEVVHRPGHGVTVSDVFRAKNLDHSLRPALLAPGVFEFLSSDMRAKLAE
ncbi:sulfurase [Nocardioides baekrokdamisoli]|uniref:Sulfurase n=1 Tax=Nocardioides baekrokdamisoli TaxID=1804624 RepID=A0A3G9IBB1_9ACTN|nr:MOSC domain-containing protein [Nocardioides baekrokdamisoli]BBH16097.1 sulfurase [Nocardioides baekrokdamisoli]